MSEMTEVECFSEGSSQRNPHVLGGQVILSPSASSGQGPGRISLSRGVF